MKSCICSSSDQPHAMSGETLYSDLPEKREPSQNIAADCKTIEALIERAWGHSEEAARKARQIAVALQQWPNKTDAGKACERPLLLKDIDALSAMMFGR